jgi:hypothetical protein
MDERPGRNLAAFLPLPGVVLPAGAAAILVTVLSVGWFVQPDRYVRGHAPSQPIAFSHKLHAGDRKIPCLYCHGGAEKSRFAGIPAVSTCMNCHKVTRTDRPAIQELAAHYESGEPFQWRRVHALPDHVFFDHRPHVTAGIVCQTCHGEVGTMEVISQQISLRMGNCLGCHRDPKAALPEGSTIVRGAENCNACHR